MNKTVLLDKIPDGYFLIFKEVKKKADGSTRTSMRSTFIADDEFEDVYRVLFLEHFKKEDKKMKEMKSTI
ncbi:MAG: hypothetical protein ACREHC_08960 [Candidatus Levyibacteriota bacterium]